jgi:hypothetical protein
MKKIFIITLTLLTLGSCKKLDRLLVNPNNPDPSEANTDLYFTQLQLSFVGLFNDVSGTGMELTRQIVMYGPNYQNAYSTTSFDGVWSTAYTGVFKHANELIPKANTEKKFAMVGIAKILKAYTMMTMVDMFGDVPYVEANLAGENTNPKADKGVDIYAKAIVLLDEAIADIAKTGAASYPGTLDLFYGASNATGAANWRRVAKTLKLRAYMNTRLVQNNTTAISALLTENDLINTTAQDFEFKYGNKLANPNTRHPRYNGNYTASGNAGDYIGTHFLWTVAVERGSGANADPRLRYYFYRQVNNNAQVTANTSSCSVETRPGHYTTGSSNPYTGATYDMPFCLVSNGTTGYWGRDHGDNSGIPPDGNLRTTVGIYPFGGEFDDNQASRVTLERGARGAGIQPIWQSAFTDFLRAEAAQVGIIASDPKVYLESGMRKSITKVTGYPATVSISVNPARVPSQTAIDNFVARVLNAYNLGATASEQMDVIMKEYYVALWGNGIDAYNMYRRTGKPGNFQFTKIANPGTFIRTFLYPSVYTNLNLNATPKPGTGVETPVFWDNNPASLFR